MGHWRTLKKRKCVSSFFWVSRKKKVKFPNELSQFDGLGYFGKLSSRRVFFILKNIK